MYGSYVDVLAYNQDSEEDHFGSPFYSTSEKERTLGESQVLSSTLKSHSSASVAEDFILFAEFCEIIGPQPLFTIPSEVEVGFDLNEFALRLLSVDHQVSSLGCFTVNDDAQVFLSDPITGIQAYVHYFTLYDINARGYVRPMCVAYITRDRKKILDNFAEMRAEFLEVTRVMKFGNRSFFVKEARGHLQGLQITKEQYLNWKREAELNNWSETSMSPKYEFLKGITLEVLASSIGEIQHVIHSVSSTLDDREAEEVLQMTRRRIRASNSSETLRLICPFLFGSWPTIVEHENEETKLKCSLAKLSRFEVNMKTVPELCKWGFVLGISLLNAIHKFYRRDTLTLHMEAREQELIVPSEGSLSMNGCLVGNVLQEINEQEIPKKSSSLASKCSELKLNFSELESLLGSSAAFHKKTSDSVIDDEEGEEDFSDVFDSLDEETSLTKGIGPNSSFIPSQKRKPQSNKTSKATETIFNIPVNSIVCHIENFTPDKPGYGIAQVFHKYNCCIHIMYSLLIGRPLVIIGSKSSEDEVRSIVQAFALLLPEQLGRGTVLPWSHNIPRLKDLTKQRLIGICARLKRTLDIVPQSVKQYVSVLDVDNKVYQGPLYTGIALKKVIQSLSLLTDDVLLVSHLFSVFAAMASKVFLYYHCSLLSALKDSSIPENKVCKPSALMMMMSLEVSKQDISMIKYLVEILKEKQMSCKRSVDKVSISPAPALKVVHEQLAVVEVASRSLVQKN